MAETSERSVTIAKQRFDLRRETVERAMRQVLPEPISSHYVVIGPRRYPPKQVLALVTGLDRADFTSHQARRILLRLGFAAGRIPPVPSGLVGNHGQSERIGGERAPVVADSERRRKLGETLAALPGQWVAIKDDELLVAASTPQELVSWLAQYNRRADSMFRVPEDELAAGGLAPL
jgi:hypothetical protein